MIEVELVGQVGASSSTASIPTVCFRGVGHFLNDQ